MKRQSRTMRPTVGNQRPGPKRPDAAKRAMPEVQTLWTKVQVLPFDPLARLRLAVALFDAGQPKEGAQHLAFSFRLHGAMVLKLLQEPGLARIRRRKEVQRLLMDYHRDAQRRANASYA